MVNIENFSQFINPQALQVCRILQEADYQAYIVGGCVRDLILNTTPKDWDITTNATPEQIMSLFPKTYPTGLQHGTITVAMDEGVENHFEVTTFRVEGKYEDGRRPSSVSFVSEVEQDLARRDLTINAIAYDPINQKLIDPFNGLLDLEHKIIRAVGKSEERFQEDGLRIMRVARFAARFGYLVDENTLQGMQSSINTLRKVSKERIQDELCKILMTKRPGYGLQLLQKVGAMPIACPMLNAKSQYLYFLPHLDRCQAQLETRLALLYVVCSMAQVQEELINLKFANKESKRVMFLLDLLDKYNQFVQEHNLQAYRAFIAFVKNQAPDPWEHTLEQFIQLTEAMGFDSRAQFAEYAHEVVLAKKELQLNGDDLINLGIKPGPQIKNILEASYSYVLNNPQYNNKMYLQSWIQSLNDYHQRE